MLLTEGRKTVQGGHLRNLTGLQPRVDFCDFCHGHDGSHCLHCTSFTAWPDWLFKAKPRSANNRNMPWLPGMDTALHPKWNLMLVSTL
jgi:hypothetical protein